MSRKPKLSKGVLEMKFMKRTKEKVEKEDAVTEGRAMYANEITEKMLHGSNFIIEPSYVHCENLINGRMSFRGMNDTIEKLMEQEEAAKRTKLEEEKQPAEVNDEEMAAYYGNLVKTMRNKFSNYRKRNNPRESRDTNTKYKKQRRT